MPANATQPSAQVLELTGQLTGPSTITGTWTDRLRRRHRNVYETFRFAGETIHVEKVLVGSKGTIVFRVQTVVVWIDACTATFKAGSWQIVGGTGAYERLRGADAGDDVGVMGQRLHRRDPDRARGTGPSGIPRAAPQVAGGIGIRHDWSARLPGAGGRRLLGPRNQARTVDQPEGWVYLPQRRGEGRRRLRRAGPASPMLLDATEGVDVPPSVAGLKLACARVCAERHLRRRPREAEGTPRRARSPEPGTRPPAWRTRIERAARF